MAMFLASVSWSQVLPFLPLFLREMGVAKKDLLQWSGVVFAAQSLASIITLPFWGKLGDKYGQKEMTLRAGFFLVLIYFGMSVCRTPLELAVLRFLNGALTGFIPGSIALIATNTPKAVAPRSVATAQTCAAAGGIAGPAIGGLLNTAFGFRGTMQVSGTAVLISAILVAILVKVTNRPEPPEKTSLLQDFRVSLKSPVTSSIMLTMLLSAAYMTAIQPFLALHLAKMVSKRYDWVIGPVFSLPALAFLLSAHPWTRFGERRGFDQSIRYGLIGAAVCAFLLSLANNIWTFSLLFFLAGLCLATTSPSSGAVICTKVEEGFRGRAYGMLYSASTLGAFLAPLASSNIAAAAGIPWVFVSIGCLLIAGTIAFNSLAARWNT